MPKRLDRAHRYLSLIGGGVNIKEFLGEGTDGAVWATNRDTAVKVFDRRDGYENERDTYERLKEYGITQKLGKFWVAQMVDSNDDLMIVEMDLMQKPPYIIDFAKVRLNSPPDFPERTLEDMDEQGRDLFGPNWPAVQSLLADLESLLIFYLDPKPHNIVFPPSSPPPSQY